LTYLLEGLTRTVFGLVSKHFVVTLEKGVETLSVAVKDFGADDFTNYGVEFLNG
jgi:hypothetical protein